MNSQSDKQVSESNAGKRREHVLNASVTLLFILFFITLLLFRTGITGHVVVQAGQAIDTVITFSEQSIPLGSFVRIEVHNQTYEKSIVIYLGDPHEIMYDGATIYGYVSSVAVNLSGFPIQLPAGNYTLTTSLIYDTKVLDRKLLSLNVVEPIVKAPSESGSLPQQNSNSGNITSNTTSSNNTTDTANTTTILPNMLLPTLEAPSSSPQPPFSDQGSFSSPTDQLSSDSSSTSPQVGTVDDVPIPPDSDGSVGAAVSQTACDTLSTSNYYTLTQNVSANDTCFFITGSNIVLDCAGFAIEYGAAPTTNARGIQADNIVNFTVTGCFIQKRNDTRSGSYGMLFTNVSNSTIRNTSISTNGTSLNAGIRMISNSSNNTVMNITIYTHGSESSNDGVALDSKSQYNVFDNITISTNGSTQNRGFFIIQNSSNTTISNSRIYTNSNTSGGNNVGIWFENSQNGTFYGNIIQTNGTGNDLGLYFFTEVNNTQIVNNTIITGDTGSPQDGIRIDFSSNVTIQNNTIVAKGDSTIYGIHINGSVLASTVRTNVITTSATSPQGIGIFVESNVENISISNNTIFANGTTTSLGIRLTSSSKNITISDNNITTYGTANGNDGIGVDTLSGYNVLLRNVVVANGSAASNRGIFINNASNNTILTNTVQTYGPDVLNVGIRVVSSANTSVLDNNITTNGSNNAEGIWLFGATGSESNYSTIRNNSIRTGVNTTAFNFGIHIDGTYNLTIANNTIVTNGTSSNRGIFINTTYFSLVTANTITTGRDGPNNYGVYVYASTNNTVSNNTITTNGSGSDYGIYMADRALNNTIKNNTVYANTRGGGLSAIYIYNQSSGNAVLFNILSVNGTQSAYYGVFVDNTSQNTTIHNNEIRVNGNGDGQAGVFVRFALNTTVDDNIIRVNGTSDSPGIAVTHYSNSTIVRNNSIIVGSNNAARSFGIKIEDSSSNSVSDNNITTNGSSNSLGIFVNETEVVNQIWSNLISTFGSGANNFGIYLVGSANVSVWNNTITTNGTGGEYGIYLANSASNNTLSNNTIYTYSRGENLYAVYFANFSRRNVLQRSILSTNGTSSPYYGITLDINSDNATIYNNEIRVNANGASNRGIFINSSLNTTITDNTVRVNGSNTLVGIFLRQESNFTFLRNNSVYVGGNQASQLRGIQVDAGHSTQMDYNNITINGTTSNYGIFLNRSVLYTHSWSNLVTLLTTSDSNYGAYIYRSTNASFWNNTITVNGSGSGNGIFVEFSGNTTLFNNTIFTDGNASDNNGININNLSGYTVVLQNIISTNGSGGGNDGVFVNQNSSNTTIKNNVILTEDGGIGVYINNSQNVSVFDNRITTNGTGNDYGVRLSGITNTTIIQNNSIVAGSPATSRNYGIQAIESNLTTIIGNNITTQGVDFNWGIFLNLSVRFSRVINNSIRTIANGTGNVGINMLDALDVRLENNTITTRGSSQNIGIFVDQGSGNATVANNTIRTNGTGGSNIGIFVNASVNASIRDNNVVTNGSDILNLGIYLLGSSRDASVINNTLTTDGASSQNFGIYIRNNSINSTVMYNYITTEGLANNYGIYVDNNISNTILQNNTIEADSTSSNIGIFLANNATSSGIIANTVTSSGDNGVGGVSIHNDSRNNRVLNNSINVIATGSINTGIELFNRVYNITVANSSINVSAAATNNGIRLSTSADNNSVDNTTIIVHGSSAGNIGFELFQSNNNTFTNNNISARGSVFNIGALLGDRTNRSVFVNNTVSGGGSSTINDGFLINNSNSNELRENIIITNGTGASAGIELYGTASSNIFLNNNITAIAQSIIINDRNQSSTLNFLIYNTSSSEIRFLNSTFTDNISVDISGGLGINRNIYVVNNSVAINDSALLSGVLNTSANITMYNISLTTDAIDIFTFDTFTTNASLIRENGTSCNATTCRILLYDAALDVVTFNVSSFSSYTVAAEKNPPVVTALVPVNNTTFNITTSIEIAANVTDNDVISAVVANLSNNTGNSTLLTLSQAGGTRIYNTTYTIPNVTGVYNITIVANDTNANINRNQTTQFNAVDQMPPNISAQSCTPSSIITGNSTICNATITDHTGIILVQANVTLPNGTVESQTISNNTNNFYFNFSNTQINGTYNITWTANDTNGYFNNSRVISTFTLNDTYKPTVTALVPTNNTSFNVSTTIEIAANVTDNGTVNNVQANITQVNGSTVLLALSQAGGTRIYNNTYLIPNVTGVYNITIIGNDTNGNINTNQTTQVNGVDQIQPSITNLGCSPNNFTTGNSTFCNATITDHTTIQTIQANVTLPNGTIEAPTISNVTSNFYFNYSNTQINGTYTIVWIANDTSSNINTTRTSAIFTLNDTYKPTVTAIVPTNNTSFNVSTTIQIAANVTDNGTVSAVMANVSQANGTTVLLALSQAGGTRIYNTTYNIPSTLGTLNITIIANDTNLNANRNQTSQLTALDEIAPTITLLIPENNTNIINTSINFTWYVTDNQDLNLTCNLTISGVVNQSSLGVVNNTNFSAIVASVEAGPQNWSIRCVDNNPTHNTSVTWQFVKTLPSYRLFSNNSVTTNFSAVSNIENVANLTIASDHGVIRYRNNLNASTANFDASVIINPLYVSVNTSALIGLDADYNATADIVIYNVSCPVTTIATRDGFFSTRPDIQANGTDCEAIGKCTNIVCQDNTLNFTVTSFSGFSSEGNANLTIDNTGPITVGTLVQFNASYINSTSGAVIPSANCTIRFQTELGEPLSGLMSFNLSGDGQHRFNRTFVPEGIYNYNVTCNATGFTTLLANDTMHNTPIPDDERDGPDNIPPPPTGGVGSGAAGGGKSEPKRSPRLPTPESNPPLYDLDFPTSSGPSEPLQQRGIFDGSDVTIQEVVDVAREAVVETAKQSAAPVTTSYLAVQKITALLGKLSSSIVGKASITGKTVSAPFTALPSTGKMAAILVLLVLNILAVLLIRDIRKVKEYKTKKVKENEIYTILRNLDNQASSATKTLPEPASKQDSMKQNQWGKL
ncbi:right-handed parallel beta-helix repeat-containing protein [Candidatus Woesearchaeota archaeon]|nr:right-handed parallel beta-helix repeat-containing protein [Candidatus Woesearchaeota archaeon]